MTETEEPKTDKEPKTDETSKPLEQIVTQALPAGFQKVKDFAANVRSTVGLTVGYLIEERDWADVYFSEAKDRYQECKQDQEDQDDQDPPECARCGYDA